MATDERQAGAGRAWQERLSDLRRDVAATVHASRDAVAQARAMRDQAQQARRQSRHLRRTATDESKLANLANPDFSNDGDTSAAE